MIIYNSMIIVVLVLTLIYRLQTPSLQQRLGHPIPWGYAIISMGYITLWVALRSGFADTRGYIILYEAAPDTLSEAMSALHEGGKSPGWNFIQIVFKTLISHDFHYWLAFIAIATAIPITLTLRKESNDFLFSIFLFLTSGTFTWMVNGIRQFLVVSILFGFYYLIVERKKILFISIVILCSLIHTTAIIMLPAVFFVDLKPFGKVMMLFVALVLTSAFFVSSMLDSMETMLQGSAYHGNLSQFAEDDGVHPLRVAFEAVPVTLALFKRKQIAALKNRLMNLCINMSTVAAGLFFIGMLTSGIMVGRLPMYFSIYNLILWPMLINKVYSSSRRMLYNGCYVVFLVYYFLMNQGFYYISDILGNYL